MNNSVITQNEEMVVQQQTKDESAEAPSSSTAPPAETEKDENYDKETSTVDDASLKGTALLKSLLSTSTASSMPVVDTKMITTTEVTDETLNLKKILYQPDREKKDDKEPEMPTQNPQQANTSDTRDDDDRRLVIDISDEEKDVSSNQIVKSMPVLTAPPECDYNVARRMPRPATLDTTAFVPIRPLTRHLIRIQENQLPKSITYNIEPTATSGANNSVKIDILAPAMNQTELPPAADKNQKASSLNSHNKCSKLSSVDELNVISHEIDKQITKKTNLILELLKEYLDGKMEKDLFLSKMSDATETSLSDLVSVAKKLIKRHKFEPNPNHKEFMRIKFLQFPTTSKDLVIYFDNLLPSLNKDKFISMIKFYEIIIKEMMNLNKTKILQYLIDFMVVRKNAQLDLLNYNFQVTSAPNFKQPQAPTTKFQLPDSTQNPSERRPMRLMDTSYNFIIRSDPIYLQAGSSFVTNHRDVISCRMSPRKQMRSFERRPFDNNILRGRRIGRRLVRSPEDEKLQAECMRSRFPLTPQSEVSTPLQPLQQMAMIRSSTPIVVESDTPPPSLSSEPPSPPPHRIVKVHQMTPTTIIKPSRLDQPVVNGVTREEAVEKNSQSAENQNEVEMNSRQSMKRRYEPELELNSSDPLQNGQISMQEIQALSQNGTEIIPTSILKNTIMSRRPTLEHERVPLQMMVSTQEEIKAGNRFTARGISHDDTSKPNQSTISKMPKRRQSCHERIMMPVAESEEKTIENSLIGQNYMEFLNMFENEINKKKQQEAQQQRQQMQFPQQLHSQPKRVRFSMEVDNEETHRSPQNHQSLPPFQYQPPQQHQMENQQRMVHYQGQQVSPLRSPLKPHPPQINYQYYQHQFERELRERGYDHRIESHQEPNRPLELVSHIPPERYHQHEQQRSHYANHFAQKQIRPVQEKPRMQPRTPSNMESQQAAMMAAAYHQLQSLHRDPSTLTPQQYAEHLKQLDHLKHMQPSAFSAYQRNPRPVEGQRPPPEYYQNTQEMHQQAKRSSPVQYQISSSSSREDSPNGYEGHQEQSLQRKLKSKLKSTKYIEPNQLTKPFYNPAHSTYYSEPFALTKNKPTASTSASPPTTPTAFHLPEIQRPRSPVARNLIDSATNSKHYQWFVAQAHANAHAQNLAVHNQPQRPIPRPPVPTFIEAKVNGTSHHPMPLHFSSHQEQPTEFLRNYYATTNQKNF